MTQPTILVVNDDGIMAKGIRSLIEVAKEYGNVIVVAPDGARSGMSHAITMNVPLRIKKVAEYENVVEYVTNGTPVDCVKLAQKVILKRMPDLVLSGINHGANTAISLMYSGTMAAALEAAFEQTPAIGFSLLSYDQDADFSACKVIVKQVVEAVLSNVFPKHGCLNINIPDLPIEQIKGLKITRQAKGFWKEDLVPHIDPHGQEYYWLTGEFFNQDEGTDTDIWAVENNYVSVQPVHFDLTDHRRSDRYNFLAEINITTTINSN
jgi:5'-nucleotidase